MSDAAGLVADVRLTREQKKAQTRQRLLDAAWSIFIERGFLDPTLDDIAEAAGLTKGAIYSNFSGKDDLVLAVIESHAVDELIDNVQGTDLAATIDDQATAAAQRLAGSYEPRAMLFYLEFTLYAAHNPELSARFGAIRRELRETIAEVIERASVEVGGALPMSPSHLATLFLAFANGLALERINDPELPAERLFADLVRLVYLAGDQIESGTFPS